MAPLQKDPARGKRIAQARTARGLSQRALARAMEIDAGTVSRWERGTLYPRDHMRALCKTLRVTPEWIAFGVDSGRATDTQAYEDFLAWLKTAPERHAAEPWMLETIRATRFRLPPGREPTVETYRGFLLALFTTEKIKP